MTNENDFVQSMERIADVSSLSVKELEDIIDKINEVGTGGYQVPASDVLTMLEKENE